MSIADRATTVQHDHPRYGACARHLLGRLPEPLLAGRIRDQVMLVMAAAIAALAEHFDLGFTSCQHHRP
jgi:hypothetical protein